MEEDTRGDRATGRRQRRIDVQTVKAILVAFCALTFSSGNVFGQTRPGEPGAFPLTVPNTATPATNSIVQPFYRYGYYLFLADSPHACEDCYVPLLITSVPLERLSDQTHPQGVWITTYERDSVWQMEGAVDLNAKMIEVPSRKIQVSGHVYRYQPAQPTEVLKLLQNPNGTIPVSRPLVPNKVAPGGSLEELLSNYRTLLRVFERHAGPIALSTGKRLPESTFTSLLTVLEDGRVNFRLVPDCYDHTKWDCPAGTLEKLFHYQMTPAQLSELRTLLERQEVKQASAFLDAAPIDEDYEIEIPRSDQVQDIPVLALLPSHFELQGHPALLYLICKAKEIEHLATNEQEVPGWCNHLPPLK